MTPPSLTLAEFNAAAGDTAAAILGACLDVAEWVDGVAGARPYPDLESLRAAAAARAGLITWQQVAGALNRHPRIGEATASTLGTATERAWSVDEQAGVTASERAGAQVGSKAKDTADQQDALASGNAGYEHRFGHIFLICAAGLSGEQILAALHRRLGNSIEQERPVVIAELRKIAALRLAKAVR